MSSPNTVDLSKKRKEFKPHQVVHQGKTFVLIDGEDDVIMLQSTVNKVYKYIEHGGQPVLNPKTKQQMYDIVASVIVSIMPNAEYLAIKKSGLVEK